MINRENFIIVKEYLSYLKDEKQLDTSTVRANGIASRILLEYADGRLLNSLQGVKPMLPDYLATKKNNRTGSFLSVAYRVKILENIRHFYEWARLYKRNGFSKVNEAWVENLRVKRSAINANRERNTSNFWELETVLKVAKYEPTTLREERMQASICFLFLSGMRITAFCSLPVNCVDIENGRIEQKPSRGVITKNRKSAVTFLLPIPDLLAVVTRWDMKIRAANSLYWFAPFELLPSSNGWLPASISEKPVKSVEGRRGLFDTDLRDFCTKVDVPIMSAHKIRHGFGRYGIRMAKTIEEFKVISQTMMHSNMGITDGLYGVLPEENMKRVLATFISDDTPDKEIVSGNQELPEDFVKFAKMLYAQMKK